MMRRRTFFQCAASVSCLSAQVASKVSAQPGGGCLTAVHTMVDMPEWASDLGKYWNPVEFVRLCREAQVGVIELKTKNAAGDAMFPFKGRPCHRDWTTETCRTAREAGIQFIAYYNVGLDNWYAAKKPEWRCVDPAGNPKIGFGAYNWMCIRSPWRDVVLSEVRQVQEALKPPGMWFDILGTPNAYGMGSHDPAAACFCKYCRSAYHERFGEDLPASSEEWEVRRRIHRFGHEARIAMFRDLTDMLRRLDPSMEMGYNGAGNYDELNGTPQDLRDRVTFNSSEAKPHRLVSFSAKILQAAGKPFQIHTYGGFMRMQPSNAIGTWAAWNLIPSTYLDVTAAVASAHSGRTCIGVNPLPDGEIQEDELRNIGRTLRAVKEREPWLRGLRSVPGMAVLYDASSDLAVMPIPKTPNAPSRIEATGLHNALLESGFHFDVLPVHLLRPEEHRVLLLGNAYCPPVSVRAAIERFLENGGLLIATHETSLRDERGVRLPDFAWGDLLGVRFKGVSRFEEANYGLLGDELRGTAPRYPIFFQTVVLEIECAGARPLAGLVYPEGRRSKDIFTDAETPHTHFGKPSGKPLITINQVGKGRVIYIAGPIGAEIAARDDTWLKLLLTHAVKRFGSGLPISAQLPPGIQVVFSRGRGTHVVSLVNHYAGMVVSGEPNSHPQVGPVRLEIPLAVLGGAPRDVQPVDAAGFRWKVEGPVLRLQAETIGHHAVLRIVN
ncbi:MAG TPA: hypothetical protein PKJ41_00415 [Bryobacteraceae bacterium]|nr:hypothetical protein [Bryobacteraceae bacterium]